MSDSLTFPALVSMGLLSLQFGLQPLLTKKYTPANSNKSVVVMTTEFIKFFLAGTSLIMSLSSKDLTKLLKLWSPKQWIAVSSLPAVLYAIQNNLALMAYTNLDSVTFNVLNQTKTISAAFWCYLLLGRRQSLIQCFALIMLVFAAVIIEGSIDMKSILSGTASFAGEGDVNVGRFLTGILPCLAASFISGLAGALSQRMLQGSNARNSYMYSMELSSFSFFTLLMSLPFSGDGGNAFRAFATIPPMQFLPIVSNAAGGIIVGLVTKYAGSVRKGFALILGIVLTGVIHAVGEGKSLQMNQMVGGGLVIVSMYLHGSYGVKSVKKGKKEEDEIEAKATVSAGGKGLFKTKKKKSKQQ